MPPLTSRSLVTNSLPRLSLLSIPSSPLALLILANVPSPTVFDAHHRRRSSALPSLTLKESSSEESHASGFEDSSALSPGLPVPSRMSLSRSPSPRREGGWSSPGLTTSYNGSARRPSPMSASAHGGPGNVKWTAAQNRTSNKASSFAPLAQGFARHFRKVSGRLPVFSAKDYSDKEKLGRGRWIASTPALKSKDILPFLGRMLWRARLQISIVSALLFFFFFILSRK